MGGRLGGDGGVVGICLPILEFSLHMVAGGWVCVKTRSSYVKGDNIKQLLAARWWLKKVLVICL